MTGGALTQTKQLNEMVSTIDQMAENATGKSPALEIHDMTVAYHRRPVLWDIDLVVPEGKLVGMFRGLKVSVHWPPGNGGSTFSLGPCRPILDLVHVRPDQLV